MAHMIPDVDFLDDENHPAGEIALYELLKQLPDDYHVFYSTCWNERLRMERYPKKQYVKWGEGDFTVFHPKYGLIVFEVKDGIILKTQNEGWIQKNRYTGEEKTIDPMNQARKTVSLFQKILENEFGEKQSPYFVCAAVWFTTPDRNEVEGELPLNCKEEIVKWASDMDSVASVELAIRQIYSYYDVNSFEPSEELTNKIIDLLAPEFGAFPSIRTRAIASKAMFKRMTREQAYLLEYLDEQEVAAIHGVAGTGKTVLANRKAEDLAKTDKVLFLCYNSLLKEEFINTQPNPNVEYHNLDDLIPALTNKPLPADSNERDMAILEALMNWENYTWKYKHIIIDEGQDFVSDHLQALHEIAEKTGGSFYVFYDKNQFVHGFEFPEWLDKMDCRLVLTRNCRNTKEIAITSTRPIGIEKSKIKMRREDPGAVYSATPLPNMFFVQSKEQLKESLVKLIGRYAKSKISLERIVVLTCKTMEKSVLSKEDYNLTYTYKLSEAKEPGKILFTTVRRFKGLEADVVICIDIDEETFANERMRNAFYVGTSRATTYLDLFTMSNAVELARGITDETYSERMARKKINENLCVKIGTETDLTSTKLS